MELLNGTRFGTFLQTILYLTGVPVFVDNEGHSSIRIDGRASGLLQLNLNNIVSSPHPDGEIYRFNLP
jgi:hypothetical protein